MAASFYFVALWRMLLPDMASCVISLLAAEVNEKWMYFRFCYSWLCF
jgi:hypothetical protein